MEKEKESFRKVISGLLQSLPRICNERDVRKAYREQENHNINIMIDKVSVRTEKVRIAINVHLFKLDAGTLYNFLRFQCKDICDVYKNDGEVKVHRLDLEPVVEVQPKSHKKKNKNAAPKLK